MSADRLHMPACSGIAPGQAAELVRRLAAVPWLELALDAVAASGLPEAWIGAGAIRDVVWGELHGGFDPAAIHDVDVAYFDPENLGRERDDVAERQLRSLADLPWEATNQATVHTWYHQHFGGPPVAAFGCVHDAVATWPETATCVAVRKVGECLDICAPLGLADLLDGVWHRNPARVSIAESRARLSRHQVGATWPRVRVVPP